MGRKYRLRDRVASIFELPQDVMLDIARINLIGDQHLVIENHRGLQEYRMDRIVLETPHGRVAIAGENLSIASISPDQMTVTGKIRGLQYLG